MRGRWVLVGLLGCGRGPGSACEATGEGFGRRDPCTTECVGWEVACADGTLAVPGVCSGDPCTADTDCPDGWGCAAIDSFDQSCLPTTSCPDGFSLTR